MNSRWVKKIKDMFGRIGRRGKRNTHSNDGDKAESWDNDKGDIASTLYSFHVVEKGFEVQVERRDCAPHDHAFLTWTSNPFSTTWNE